MTFQRKPPGQRAAIHSLQQAIAALAAGLQKRMTPVQVAIEGHAGGAYPLFPTATVHVPIGTGAVVHGTMTTTTVNRNVSDGFGFSVGVDDPDVTVTLLSAALAVASTDGLDVSNAVVSGDPTFDISSSGLVTFTSASFPSSGNLAFNTAHTEVVAANAANVYTALLIVGFQADLT